MTTVGGGKFGPVLGQCAGVFPAGQSFGAVSAVDTDSQDRVYVFQRAEPPVVVFDRHGNFVSHHRRIDLFHIIDRAENGAPPQVSLLDGEGSALARWPSRSAHGSWVDAHGDIYLALTAEQSVDKYIRQS